MTAANLLLISSSNVFGAGYLDHAENAIRETLGGLQTVAFVPYALYEHDAYALKAKNRFHEMGYRVLPVHSSEDPKSVIEDCQAIFIGGGNTFRLLRALYLYGLIDAVRKAVASGKPYIGASAGSNVACPTIKTTKDMPIVWPHTLDALRLVPFQISPHYQDPDPDTTHMGETQEERIFQFLEENATAVVGLREASMIRVKAETALLLGSKTARIFRKNEVPVEAEPGSDLLALL